MANESTQVTPESETSGQAQPMAEVPAEPTEAQQEQADVTGVPKPSREAVEQARKDAEEFAQHPNKAVTREANPSFGGESFAYLDDNA